MHGEQAEASTNISRKCENMTLLWRKESDKMSAEKLNEIKERAEKATSGPWTVDSYGEISSDYNADDVVYVDNEGWLAGKRQDLEFIAHAREDIPALVAEVERLNIEIADREQSHINLYNDNQRILDALKSACNSLGADISDYYDEGER